jgi:hypothetical protein
VNLTKKGVNLKFSLKNELFITSPNGGGREEKNMLDNRVIRKVRKTQHHQNHPEFWSYTG